MKANLLAVKKILSELNYILSGKQKKRALAVLVVIVIGSGFELIGVTAILPFMQILLTPEVVMENQYVRPIRMFFHIESSMQMIVLIGIGLMLVYIFKNLYMIFSYYVQYDYSAGIQKELSIRMLHAYMSRPYTYFLDTNSSEILRGCGGDIGAIYNILANLFTVCAETLAAMMIGVYIIAAEPMIALGVLTLLALVMLFMILVFKPTMKRLGRKRMRADADKNQAIYQTINGVKELFVMQRKELFVDDYEKASEVVRKVTRNYEFANNIPERIIEGVCVSGLIGIVVLRLMLGVDMLSFVPKLGAFAMAAFKIMPSVGKISGRINGIVYNFPMMENVYRNMKDAEEYERKREEYRKAHETIEEKEGLKFQELLSVKNVFWQYHEQTKPVLDHVSLDIRKGESIGLIGPSGSGKTTLSDVILGLLQPQQGGIYMDGIDVYTIPRTWAHIVGYVPQSVFLIDDTIRNNVAFGMKDIDDARIWEALERAQMRSFVEELPGGLDTIVGERGVKFSGGQRQRIAIARALFNEPEILVLDEATAALDNETEYSIMGAIEGLQGQITMIIVAHRLTTIRNCDKIYEVRDGIVRLRDKEEVLQDIYAADETGQ